MDVMSSAEIEPTTLAYLAGIIDGEGAVTIARIRDPRYADGVYYRGQVQVGNTRRDLVDYLNRVFPASIQGPYQPRNSIRAKPVYYWISNGKMARVMLRAVMPYLLLKRRQAELCLELEYLKALRRPQHADGRFVRGAQFAPEVKQRMVEIWEEARTLNKRGVDLPEAA
jgi:hypothetical protein